MSEDINVTDGTVLEALNNKVDLDGGNYKGSPLEAYIHEHCGGGHQLFDLIEKDHILTYEESKGLALLGTYVYKEAVAGSRYGYPDFYNKVVTEKEAGTPTEITLGENTVTMYVNSNGHAFYDIADKGAVDAFYETYGVAWYYGVDVENERVFLPRNDWFTQGGSSDDVGKFVEAGLPNITGALTNIDSGGYTGTADGAFTKTTSKTAHGRGTENSSHGNYSFDASSSNAIYGKSNTVQPKAVKKLFYMCVGNTETTSTITDVVDVTTTENDTIPLFTGMYFDFTPNNVSWLKAGEQKNSGGIYETAYNELVKALTTSREASTFSSNQVTKNITPTKVGAVNDDPIETQAYYFSENDYLSTTLEVGSEPFELQFKFRTPADVTTSQIVASTEYAEITLAISNGLFYHYSYGEESFAQCLPSTTYTCALGRANGMTYYKVSTDNGDTWTTQDYAYPLGDTTVTLNFGKPNGNTEKGANPFTGVIDLTSFVLTSTETQENTPTNIIFDGKVINIDDMQDGVDYSEYWKVDVNAETFTTPTAISNKALSGAVVGNGLTLGFMNASQYGGLVQDSSTGIVIRQSVYGSTVGSSGSTGLVNGSVGVTTDPTKSGIIAEQSTAQLYFKVANAVQNLELLDAGEVLEAVNNVVPNNSSLISSYAFPSNKHIELTLGATGTTYTAPANGWFQLQMGYVADKYVDLWNSTAGLGCIMSSASSGWSFRASVPCKKGDVVTAYYTATNVSHFRFIYAQGEVQ